LVTSFISSLSSIASSLFILELVSSLSKLDVSKNELKCTKTTLFNYFVVKFDQICSKSTKWINQNSNLILQFEFDVEIRHRIRCFLSNFVLRRISFEIRPSLPRSQKGWELLLKFKDSRVSTQCIAEVKAILQVMINTLIL